MMIQVALFCFISIAAALPQYGVPAYSSPVHEPVYDEKPIPYSFGFDTKDEYGSTLNRQESSDEQGNKKGSYGFTDPDGIYRQVDYVADEHGFRAVVKTNEPGTESQSPANAEIISEAVPVKYDAPVAYARPAAVVAPAYSKPVAAVYKPAPIYNAAPAVHSPAPVSYGPAASSYGPAPSSYNPAPVSYASAPVYEPSHLSYAPAPAAYSGTPVYEQVSAPVYGGPSYEQLADRASHTSGPSSAPEHSQYEPEAVESYSSY